MARTQRSLLLLLLFVGTMFLAISLADAACGTNCADCNSKSSCEGGVAKSSCCWNGNMCKTVDFNSDSNNCGFCGNRCTPPQGKLCCNGKCTNNGQCK